MSSSLSDRDCRQLLDPCQVSLNQRIDTDNPKDFECP